MTCARRSAGPVVGVLVGGLVRRSFAVLLVALLGASPAAAAEGDTSKAAAAANDAAANGGADGAAGAAPSAKPRRPTALSLRMTVQVIAPDEARAAIRKAAEALGGHVHLEANRQLQLRVPPQKLSAVTAAAAGQGIVLDKALSRSDRTEAIYQLEARLRSKVGVLVRMRRFLADSDVQATLQVERTLSGLIAEIEAVKGQLRVERDKARFARLDVALSAAATQKLRYVRSPFPWLNSVDVEQLVRRF
jgi:hypothetical protein